MHDDFEKLNEIFGGQPLKPMFENSPDLFSEKNENEARQSVDSVIPPDSELAGDLKKLVPDSEGDENSQDPSEPEDFDDSTQEAEGVSEQDEALDYGEAAENNEINEAEESKPESDRSLIALVNKPLKKLDQALFDPETHVEKGVFEPTGPEKRDYMPIRQRRDGKIGLVGGLMYFVFVVSVSIVLATLAWMVSTDVLALNKPKITGTIVLSKDLFSEVEVDAKDENGNDIKKTISIVDTGKVAATLKNAGIIEYPALFKLYCDISNAERKIDPGTYDLSSEFDYRALVKKMQIGSGSMVEIQIMFYEGITMKQAFELLEENEVCTVTALNEAAANGAYNYKFLEWSEKGDAARLEGYLFPDTYNFYQGMQASSAINKFLLNLHQKITADMYTQAENLEITFHQAIIIASMIEAEAANDEERALIASVIYNRIKSGMPLQIDATVQYALGERKANLTLEDLQIDSPYNTYANTGLPPGPISNPGLASINAALNPAYTDYYYYALDMETRLHKFFNNRYEHEAFVAKQDYSQLEG